MSELTTLNYCKRAIQHSDFVVTAVAPSRSNLLGVSPLPVTKK